MASERKQIVEKAQEASTRIIISENCGATCNSLKSYSWYSTAVKFFNEYLLKIVL